jgi:hypothetical protein
MAIHGNLHVFVEAWAVPLVDFSLHINQINNAAKVEKENWDKNKTFCF